MGENFQSGATVVNYVQMLVSDSVALSLVHWDENVSVHVFARS